MTKAILVLIGHLGGDAVLKNLGDATTPRYVLNFSIATQQRKDQPTLWTRVSFWGPRAQAVAPYMTKGTLVSVEGFPLPAKAFQRQDGSVAASNDAIANDIQLLSAQVKTGTVGAEAAVEEENLEAIEFA